jgi:hypothetical protein
MKNQNYHSISHMDYMVFLTKLETLIYTKFGGNFSDRIKKA